MRILDRQIVSSYLMEYLKTVAGVKVNQRGKIIMFICPFCATEPASATVIPNTFIFNCLKCNTKGDVVDIVRLLEEDKKQYSDIEMIEYLKEKLDIKLLTEKDVNKLLEFYQSQRFDLVPIQNNGKIPIEKEWTIKNHKDISEWKQWLDNDLNIGVKCGKISNVTVIDFDKQTELSKDIRGLIGNPLIQKTNSGFHLFYLYDEELSSTRIEDLKIDILNDGKQCVIFPSAIDYEIRKFTTPLQLTTIPVEFKKYLRKYTGVINLKTSSEKLIETITTDLPVDLIGEGGRTTFLMHLGGILRKELNHNETMFVLELCNKKFCKPPLIDREFRNIINSFQKYIGYDDKELAQKILNYLKIVEEAGSRDIKETLGENKERIENALAFLTKEGLLLKHKRFYHIINKLDWGEEWFNLEIPVTFSVPYFDSAMLFNMGDIILIGSKNASGKTHIAMNIIKRLVDQEIKPGYLSLESGSRWVKIAKQMGLKEGDFKFKEITDATKYQFDKNEVIVLDWLCPMNYAETDKLLQYFNNVAQTTHSIFFIFMQLRDNNEWLVRDLVKQFPALASRYIYDDEQSGEFGYFTLDKIRDPRKNIKNYRIPCRYDWQTKLLETIEEINVKEVGL